MNTDPNRSLDPTATMATEPDFSKFDSPEAMYLDAKKWGFEEELRALLCQDHPEGHGDQLSIARDIAYEFAGAKNRNLAVDVFIHATGIAEFGAASLRDYARKHGCSHEWIRREAEAMRKRLDLPLLPAQRSEKIRAKYRLVNRRNHAG